MESPTVNSLLLAERVYRDEESGQWIVAGVFNSILLPTVPAKHDRMDVFFQITNVSAPVDLHFRIESADKGEVLLDVGGPISCPSPLRVIEQKMSLREVVYRAVGKYWVQLVSNEEILTQAPLYVRLVDQEPSEEPRKDAPD
jgi:hypothetical protein